MQINREAILHLARLSKLELSAQELKQAPQELGAILSFVEKLQAVDTTGVEPTSQITGLENRMRTDEVETQQTFSKEVLRAAMPKTDAQGNLIVHPVFPV